MREDQTVKAKQIHTVNMLRAWANKKWRQSWVQRESRLGVCHNLYHLCDIQGGNLVRDNCEEWAEFSGDPLYPIVGGGHKYLKTSWMWIGKYGAARKRFCLYLADKVEQMSAEEFSKYV